MIVKKVALIRVSSQRTGRIETLAKDVLHFRNLLLLFLRDTKRLSDSLPLNDSALYSLIADRTLKKSPKQRHAYESLLTIVQQHPSLQEWVIRLWEQKKRIDNVPLVQAAIRQVMKDYRNFFKALRAYQNDSEGFTGRPSRPKTCPLKDLAQQTMEFSSHAFTVHERTLAIRYRTNADTHLLIKLPSEITEVSSVRLVYHLGDVTAHVVYEDAKPVASLKDEGHVAGIDRGLERFVTLVSTNPDCPSLTLSGGPLKAHNQWVHKRLSQLQSKEETLLDDQEEMKRSLQKERHRILNHRARFFRARFHLLSRRLADALFQSGHAKVIVGKGATTSK